MTCRFLVDAGLDVTAKAIAWFGMVSESNLSTVKDTGPVLVPESGSMASKMNDKDQPEKPLTDTSQLPYVRDPDVQLMLRTRDGDDAAFTELVNAYQDRLIGIFYHMLRDRVAAEDLAQEVFLRVYRARERYKPTARFSTWVFRIAHNLASNYRRSKGRSKEVSLAVRDSGKMATTPDKLLAEKSGLMPTRQLAKSEMREIVREAMDSLNDRQKMAVLLNKFEGMSYVDIGEAMDLSPEAVKSLLSRAREKLRERLQRFVN